VPALPRDKRGEFMMGRPSFFSHITNTMQAYDWLKSMEKQLAIAQCNHIQLEISTSMMKILMTNPKSS
jgi:hypothetical protein